jgi:hypothetical protein
MGNVIGGVNMDSGEAPTVKELMENDLDASAMAGDSRYYVREDEQVPSSAMQRVPRRREGCVKYLLGADMDVAVCSVCDHAIRGAVCAGENGEDVHFGCVLVTSISIASPRREVRPCFLEDVAPDYRLLFRVLLKNMPLERVAASWSEKCKDHKNPATVHPERFHRAYVKIWRSSVGDTPSLCELRSYAYKFLMKKCAPNKVDAAIANPKRSYNEFRWNGFYMRCDEINTVAKITICQYGLARMGHGWDE